MRLTPEQLAHETALSAMLFAHRFPGGKECGRCHTVRNRQHKTRPRQFYCECNAYLGTATAGTLLHGCKLTLRQVMHACALFSCLPQISVRMTADFIKSSVDSTYHLLQKLRAVCMPTQSADHIETDAKPVTMVYGLASMNLRPPTYHARPIHPEATRVAELTAAGRRYGWLNMVSVAPLGADAAHIDLAMPDEPSEPVAQLHADAPVTYHGQASVQAHDAKVAIYEGHHRVTARHAPRYVAVAGLAETLPLHYELFERLVKAPQATRHQLPPGAIPDNPFDAGGPLKPEPDPELEGLPPPSAARAYVMRFTKADP